MEEVGINNYPCGDTLCSGRFEVTSNNSLRYHKPVELNSEFHIKNSGKVNSRKKRKKSKKKFRKNRNDLNDDNNNIQFTLGIDLNDIPLKRHFQIIIMGDSSGRSLSKLEMLEIQQLLISEITKIAYNHRGPELKFYSSTQLNTGWILLNCHDYSTFQWVFGWAAATHKNFTMVKASEAPWKPARICLTISEMALDFNTLIRLLISQNSNLRLDNWKHIETQKVNGYWYLHFLVPGDGVWRLECSRWKVHFMLEMLPVSVLDVE